MFLVSCSRLVLLFLLLSRAARFQQVRADKPTAAQLDSGAQIRPRNQICITLGGLRWPLNSRQVTTVAPPDRARPAKGSVINFRPETNQRADTFFI